MKSITIDMEEYSVLLVVKVIGRFKKGGFVVALLSHVPDNQFNKMSLFDVRIFSFQKKKIEEQYMIVVTLVLILFSKMHHYTLVIRV